MTENLFLQDQAVSFHRPYPASLTALHEKQPEQGIFYRQDGTPFLKLWMKNACDVRSLSDRIPISCWRWSAISGR